MSADFWMNLQSAYELDLARQQHGKANPNESRNAAQRWSRGPRRDGLFRCMAAKPD